jgi:TonB family protein
LQDVKVRPAGRVGCAGRVVLLVFGVMVFESSRPAVAQPESRGLQNEALRQIAFDLPAQPLTSALEAYSAVSGADVIYNGNLARGLRSSSVKGRFTLESALEELLVGTGLSPRYMAADAFMLIPSTPDPGLTNTAPPGAVGTYYGRIQAGLRQAFCANSRTHPGDYRVAVSFWIGPSGSVSRVELLGSTGDSKLDATIDQTVHRMSVGAPPPHGFAQPITLVVAPQAAATGGDCPAAPRPIGAAQP